MEQTYKQSLASLIPPLILDFMLMSIFIGFFTLIKHVLDYLGASLTLKKGGIVLKHGIVSSSTVDIPYSKINSITVRKGMIGNVFGYGDILIMTGNDVSGIPFKGVANPDEIKAIIQSRI